MLEKCLCGHTREQHADHDNPLQVVPVGMTDIDEGDRGTPEILVRGAGPCTVPGCRCEEFREQP